VLISLTDEVQDLTILSFFTPLPIHFQLNLNTNTERVNSLNVTSNIIDDLQCYFNLIVITRITMNGHDCFCASLSLIFIIILGVYSLYQFLHGAFRMFNVFIFFFFIFICYVYSLLVIIYLYKVSPNKPKY